MSCEVDVDVKQRIARQFSRAASRYDGSALVQADIAFDAVQLVPQRAARLLDIGCGTGRVTQSLCDKADSLYAMDLAEGMVQFARAQTNLPIRWLVGDAEALPVCDAAFDSVFSTMALQWCDKLDTVFNEVYRVLAPNGRAVLAIMSQGSFTELNQSWQQLDVKPHTNRFLPANVMVELAIKAGFEVKSTNKAYPTFHQDIRCLLGSIKSIGANVVTTDSSQSMLKRSTLDELQKVYEQAHGSKGQLPLTYQVCFLELFKSEE